MQRQTAEYGEGEPAVGRGYAARAGDQRCEPYLWLAGASSYSSPLLSDFVRTIITCSIHGTYISAALRASPYIFLLLKPLLYANLLYPQQIANQAYVIIANMPLIDLLQIGAREIRALKTKLYAFLLYQCAISFDPGARFVLYATPLCIHVSVSSLATILSRVRGNVCKRRNRIHMGRPNYESFHLKPNT